MDLQCYILCVTDQKTNWQEYISKDTKRGKNNGKLGLEKDRWEKLEVEGTKALRRCFKPLSLYSSFELHIERKLRGQETERRDIKGKRDETDKTNKLDTHKMIE